MPTNRLTRSLLILLIVLLNIGCDQVSKKIVRERVAQDEIIHVIGQQLTVTNVENSGAFLSAGNSLSQPVKNIFLSLLPLLVLTGVFIYALIKKNIPPLVLLALCCIVGGGIGNIFDRIRYGSVTDFLHMDFGIFRTGIFNMADVSIMMGVAILFFSSFTKRKKATTSGPSADQQQ